MVVRSTVGWLIATIANKYINERKRTKEKRCIMKYKMKPKEINSIAKEMQ